MRLHEAKFRKPITMFHGTSSKFLPSILKHGIVPNPSKKKWDDDPHANIYQQSRASLDGSYWTSNLITATSSATNTTRKFGGEQLIVIAQIQTQSAKADEDNITYTMQYIYRDSFGGYRYDENPQMLAVLYYDNSINYEKAKDIFIAKAHKEFSTSEKTPRPDDLLANTFDAMTLRIIAYGEKENDKEWYKPLYRVDNKPDEIPNAKEMEARLLKMKDALTRHYRKSATDTESFSHTLRILDPVTYRGANRITHVVEIPEGYFTPEKTYYHPPLIIHYGSDQLPEKFMQEYTRRKGAFPGAKFRKAVIEFAAKIADGKPLNERIGSAIHLDKIPEKYRKLPLIGRGATSLVFDEGNTVILMTRDQMKKEWIEYAGLGSFIEAIDVYHPLRDLNEIPVYIYRMKKLFKLDKKNASKIRKIIKKFDEIRWGSNFPKNQFYRVVQKMTEYLDMEFSDQESLKDFMDFIVNYDESQYGLDFAQRNFMQDADGKIIATDPVVAKEILDAFEKEHIRKSNAWWMK